MEKDFDRVTSQSSGKSFALYFKIERPIIIKYKMRCYSITQLLVEKQSKSVGYI